MLKAAGPEGIAKVINSFVTAHPLFSKRQVEIKINELAVKEKRPEDQYKVWHIKDEFAHFLEQPGPGGYAPVAAAAASSSSSSAPPKTPKSEGKVKEEKGTSAAKATPGKRKRDSSGGDDGEAADGGDGNNAGSATKEPKKFKRAFGFFVKAKRAEAEEQLGEDAVVSEQTVMRNVSLIPE